MKQNSFRGIYYFKIDFQWFQKLLPSGKASISQFKGANTIPKERIHSIPTYSDFLNIFHTTYKLFIWGPHIVIDPTQFCDYSATLIMSKNKTR